ncbi:MAG TPA: type II secretion system protein GspL [Burkholderiaceae bacterium]|nr:type II secretion system protein GspL [Burkholderiaceae bacterium]
MSTLIVLLPLELSGAATPYDHVLTPDGRAMGPHSKAPANLLPAPAGATSEVVAIVPVQALSWHQVELPKGTLQKTLLSGAGNSPRLQAVLEGLLEDRLLDETADLHFALAPDAHAGAPVWVAACDRAWLRAALQPLEDAKRPVTRIVPELAPGGTPATLQVLGTPAHPQLVACSGQGIMLLPLSTAALALAQNAAGLEDDAPIAAEPAVAALAEQVLQRRVELQQSAERWLQAAQSPWDLAQFAFTNSSRSRAWKRLAAQARDALQAPRWRPARWGLAIFVAAHLLGLNAWAWKEKSALDDKRGAIRQTLTQTFPSVKVVVDAPIQMERELALLRQNSGTASGRDLEALLGATGAAASRAAATSPAPNALEFSAGELRLKGMSLPDAEAAAFNTQLRTLGYTARNEADRLVVQPEAGR